MNRRYILDEHTPVCCEDLKTWATWFERADRRVARDIVGESTVSTVFLGLDHAWGGGPPLLFETVVFQGPLDGECDRYETWDAAVAGHRALVARLQEAQHDA